MKRIIVLLLILLSTLLSAENEIGREKVEFKDKEVEKSLRVSFQRPEGDIYKDEVEKFKEFKNLSIINSNIKDFSRIKKLEEILSIKIENTKISDISFLKNLKKLKYLELKNCSITDMNRLYGLNLKSCNIINFVV